MTVTKELAPWPDFNGLPIHHGDRLVHPDGSEFVAVKLPGYADDSDAWRAIYDGVSVPSRLGLQIGDKGRAIVRQSASQDSGHAPAPIQPQPKVTEFNVGRWCLSEDECIAAGIDFAAYERGVADAAKAFGGNQ